MLSTNTDICVLDTYMDEFFFFANHTRLKRSDLVHKI